MLQNYIYIPEKIIETRKRIVNNHRRLEQSDPELEQFIRRLNGYSDGMLKAAALSLTDKEVEILAAYLPYNYYQISEKKLFEILRYRLDERSMRILFLQWQEEFTNPECNLFLKSLASSNPVFQQLLKKYHISETTFIEILDSNNIPLAYDEKLIGGQYADGVDFEKKLRYYGVAEGSYLDIECKRALLIFCGKADYFSCSEENILDIVRTYDQLALKKFLVNFLNKLSLGELQAYPGLASYLRQVTGHRNSRTFKAFFEDLPEETKQKYIDWINIFKINNYFQEDIRSRFWKQFRYVNVVRYPLSNVVILEFEAHVAVEFLGEMSGTIYLCEKTVFTKNFYDKLDAMDNEDLRLYFKTHKDLCLEYRNHTGRWQSHLNNVLIRRGIAEKIKI